MNGFVLAQQRRTQKGTDVYSVCIECHTEEIINIKGHRGQKVNDIATAQFLERGWRVVAHARFLCPKCAAQQSRAAVQL